VATGEFDFYVLSLSWSPTYCSSDASSGRDGDVQCRSGRSYGFVLHGLWPQNERGYPESCTSSEPRDVPDDVVSEVMKIAPSPKLVQHEWEKHGTCTGLSQVDYFASAAMALQSVKVPKSLRQPQDVVRITADELRDAFLAENSSLEKQDISVTCRRNDIGEVRVCLDKELHPRACSAETLKSHCGRRQARMLAVRGNWPRN
jgi:ribonuclease T2